MIVMDKLQDSSSQESQAKLRVEFLKTLTLLENKVNNAYKI